MNVPQSSLRLLSGILVVGLLYAAPAFTPQKVTKPTGSDPGDTGRNPVAAIRTNNLGVAYMNQQRFEQALRQFERAAKLDSETWAARLNQGISLYNLQRFDAAKAILEEITKSHPESVRAWYNLGLLFRQWGQSEAALGAFERVAQLDPEDADTQYFLGWMATQVEKYDQAIAAYERALALDPFHASAEFGLARALQRRGRIEESRQHLARFQKITQEKLGAPISLAYGDQGRYSLAEEVAGTPVGPPPAIPVRFASVAGALGLSYGHYVAWHFRERSDNPRVVAENAPALLGPGACFLDYDADGRPDLALLQSGRIDRDRILTVAGEAGITLLRNAGTRGFVDVTNKSGLELSGIAQGCSAGDYDNDGKADLAVSYWGGVRLFHNLGGKFEDLTAKAGLELPSDNSHPHPRPRGLFLGLTFVDYDHDGDLDLYAARFQSVPRRDPASSEPVPQSAAPMGNVLWRNNGNGTFTDWTEPTGLAGANPSFGAVLTDLNSDRAVDLVLTGTGEVPPVFLNPREGKFRFERPWSEAMPGPTVSAAVFDFDKDGWMDLAFTHWSSPGLTLWRNVKGKRFDAVSLPELGWNVGWGLAVVDFDNDGWLDLAAVGGVAPEPMSRNGPHRSLHQTLALELARGDSEQSAGPQGQIRLLRNKGAQGFEDATRTTRLAAVKLANPRALVTADYDRDGDADLLITQNAGPVVLLRNDGGNRNGWLRLAFRGLADNKSAVGTRVEVFAGRLWQRWEIGSASGYLGQGAAEILVGLGRERRADIVRILWPSGVLQDEIQLLARQTTMVEEIDRRGSSCPVLFVWNGERYEFVTDMIGAGVLGHWVAPGQQNTPDPTEYLKVEGARVRPRHGRLSFRFVEPMEETVYLDHVRLLAVDHPAGVEVYPNEQFRIGPPFAEFEVIAAKDARPPAGAWDDRGRDVLPRLLRRDQRYVDGFARQAFRGFAQLHSLELDLGEEYRSGRLRLILAGYIDYFTPTSAYAAHQAGVHAVVPYVEAQDASGRWVKFVGEMGFPAGLARTMVADLSGRIPAGTRRIRIRTNLSIYWDQILIDRTSDEPALRLAEVPLVSAELASVGYPRLIVVSPMGNVRFDYAHISPTGPYARHAGNFTRYGDVYALLTAAEDRFAVLGSGDEVALEFDPAGLSPVPSGWKRDYFFYADGFAKDMDFYAALAYTVDPLPFHRMGKYPYPSTLSYPDDAASLEYLLNYNTRQDRGTAPPSFRFQYRESRPSSVAGPGGQRPR